MDKSWTTLDPNSDEYREGVRQFVLTSKLTARNPGVLICPCVICRNLSPQTDDDVEVHLLKYGIDPEYDIWCAHGENAGPSIQDGNLDDVNVDYELPEVHQMYKDAHLPFLDGAESSRGLNVEEEYKKKVQEAEVPLFPGSNKAHTKLSATLIFYKFKASNGLSNSAFDELLLEIKSMLPQPNTFPESLYEIKKFLKEFDLGYLKYDACINDCCLFTKDKVDLEVCPECDASRWEVNPRTKEIVQGVPAKVLRYFPIIPRLKRMFLSPSKAEMLTWHSTHQSQDGMMRHPVDSVQWRTIDNKWPDFASDPRNLRIGLSTDGFNPYKNQSSTHSIWPVLLVIYNLPPNICMSADNMMLTLLIPGPKQPGNDIDVYLEPLIDDLKKLWSEGEAMYDAYTKAMFFLRVILLWTINDFPAYGNLAGLTTKGEFACPVCGPDTCSKWLPLANKTVYMGHRRFLSQNHSLRSKHKWFDGTKEKRRRPKIFSGLAIVKAARGFKNDFGKKKKPKKYKKGDTAKLLKKRSIFFDLPYWEVLPSRQMLDVMHIEKNVSEALISTILDGSGKSMIDNESRRDLELLELLGDDMPLDEKRDKLELPSAPYTLTTDEKPKFCSKLYYQRFPDGYCSNISNCIKVQGCKILGLKSHDHHVLMQQLLSVALRGLLPDGLRKAIWRLSSFFNELCQRVLDKKRLEELEDEIVLTLCMLERYFPPSFFDIMIHLTIHIGREAKLCGPVHFSRWMYPFERYMKVLKDYVKNRARPEGSIAENYLADECLKFCGQYMKHVDAISDKKKRNEGVQDDTIVEGSTLLKGRSVLLSESTQKAVHLCVLLNSKEVEPYIQIHKEESTLSDPRCLTDNNLLEKIHLETFVAWLQDKLLSEDSVEKSITDTLKLLVKGPRFYAMSHSGFIIDGKRYHTIDANVSTADYGVHVEADSTLNYYGVLKDILVLDFYTFRLVVFRCDCANVVSGVKKEDGFTLVNLHDRLDRKDPFILASHAKQVFYSRESESSSWYVVLKAPPRGFHDLELFDESVFTSYGPQDVSALDDDSFNE